MKKRIEQLSVDRLQLQQEVEEYISDYAKLLPEDKIAYNAVYNYLEVELKFLGSATIWSSDEITELKLKPTCSGNYPTTVEEFVLMNEEKESRKKVLSQVYIAFKYIIEKE